MNHRIPAEPGALADAVLRARPPDFCPNTGQATGAGPAPERSPAARAGLEVPRYCQVCGRRLVVQVRPDGWRAGCSRHGELDSCYLDRR